ncbi:MAG: hypothetical protein IPL72_06340 [Sulfuritalea sp.]|nr:hypothetical protein [Sulfuritalea sp.]
MKHRLHSLDALPDGKTIGDILPAFSGVKGEIHLVKPNEDCASCRKPFGMVRRRRKFIRLYNPNLPAPVAFDYWVCGSCLAMHQRGGKESDAFLAAVELYHNGIDQSL